MRHFSIATESNSVMINFNQQWFQIHFIEVIWSDFVVNGLKKWWRNKSETNAKQKQPKTEYATKDPQHKINEVSYNTSPSNNAYYH